MRTILIALLCMAALSFSLNCTNSTSCTANQQCVLGACVPITCDCGFIQNHTCVHYLCCSDAQCNFTQECTNHSCVLRPECAPPNICCNNDMQCPLNQSCQGGMCAPPPCDCGVVVNHACMPYRCCSNSQCAANENCMNHSCVLKSPEQCKPPDCCVSDSQCDTDEQCAVGKCASIACECGLIQNHLCTPYRCCEDSQCAGNETCVNHLCVFRAQPAECKPPGCCASDTSCADNQRCDVAPGAKNGSCVNVTGCGVIANHALVQRWECDDLASCPACAEGGCVDHKCVSAEIAAATSVSQGEKTTLHVLVQQKACGDCGLVVTSPSGLRFNLGMDEDGQAVLEVSEAGTYQVSVLKESVPLKTVTITSLAKTPVSNGTSPGTPPIKADSTMPLIIAAFVVLVVAGVGILIYFAGKEKEE